LTVRLSRNVGLKGIYMFEWLEKELNKIKTPKFHIVDGKVSEELRKAIESSTLDIPPSYKEFVLKFGNANLYRQGSIYLVRVYASPREEESNHGERLINFGRTDKGLAYFKEISLKKDEESPVYMWHGPDGGVQLSAKRWPDLYGNERQRAESRVNASLL
jgi:hypothetical protein